jgi:putative addiction module component (TIGR02574 family)
METKGLDLLREALRLSPEDRAQMAVELIASIDGAPDADAEAAWAKEIERRASRAISGISQGSDWETVRARIERKALSDAQTPPD